MSADISHLTFYDVKSQKLWDCQTKAFFLRCVGLHGLTKNNDTGRVYGPLQFASADIVVVITDRNVIHSGQIIQHGQQIKCLRIPFLFIQLTNLVRLKKLNQKGMSPMSFTLCPLIWGIIGSASYASGSVMISNLFSFTEISVSLWHLGQYNGKFCMTVSFLILILVLFLHTGHNIHSLIAREGICGLFIMHNRLPAFGLSFILRSWKLSAE